MGARLAAVSDPVDSTLTSFTGVGVKREQGTGKFKIQASPTVAERDVAKIHSHVVAFQTGPSPFIESDLDATRPDRMKASTRFHGA